MTNTGKRYLITSALPYINGTKHLGNLAGSMLPADIYARFCRMKGRDVLFICATDEHGTPAELAAAEAGQPVADYCARLHELQKSQYELLGLSFDYFGRSSSAYNHALTQALAHELESAGLIEERETAQIYSPDDRRFLPDRYVEGTCPYCGYERARGDQCDGCERLLEPTDLINPRSRISGAANLEVRATKHLFLLQSKMQARLRQWIDQAAQWPALAKSIAYKWLDEGLKDRAITRDLSWGVPVAYQGRVRPGFEDKVFYVWFDAPLAYIAATQEWGKANDADWRKWWKTEQGADDDVIYTQFMGKDNVAFHTVSFPVTLIGSGEDWKLVDRLKAMNWVNWYGGKFSTSEQRGIFIDDALSLLPADDWRWYLTASAPETSDFSFTLEGFQSGVNADLANALGNFVNRVCKFCESRFGGIVPDSSGLGDVEKHFTGKVLALIGEIEDGFDQTSYRKATAAIRMLWATGNEYFQAAAPWKTVKSDRARAATAIRYSLNLCRLFALTAAPVIPFTAARMLESLGAQGEPLRWPDRTDPFLLDRLQTGQGIAVPQILFSPIDDADVSAWKARFSAL